MLLMEESLNDIDKIKKLNKISSVPVIEKPSLMTQTILNCLTKDFLNRQKHNSLMQNLTKRSTHESSNKFFANSNIKRKPFTFYVQLKQPHKLRTNAKNEPVTYCHRLKSLQNKRDASRSRENLALKEEALFENEINELVSWNIDRNLRKIIYGEENKQKESNKSRREVQVFSPKFGNCPNSDVILFLKDNQEFINFDSLSHISSCIDWDEINALLD